MPKKRSIRRYIVPILIIVISISFFVLMIKNKPQPAQKNADERAWSIKSLIVSKGDHKPVIELYGRTITSMDIQLTAAIEADVKKRHVNLGDTVKKGQLLLSLDKTRLAQIHLQREGELVDVQMQVKTEKQQVSTDTDLLTHEKSLLEIANSALKRAKTLERRSMASNSQIDDANRTVIQQTLSITQLTAKIANHPTRLAQLIAKQQQAKSRLVLAEDDLRQTQIASPIDGVVTKVSVDNAEHVRIGSALFSISDTRNIEIQSIVPQSQYQLLRQTLSQNQDEEQNSQVNAFVQVNNMSLPATLSRLPANINSGQAGSFAFFKITDSPKLLIGQTVTVFVELSAQKNTIALPHDAIYGTNSVFIIKENRLKRIAVNWLGETYITSDDGQRNKRILIESDRLKDNDEILTSKFANAMEGLKVTTMPLLTAPTKGLKLEQ